MITLEYHRYVYDNTIQKITIVKESKLIDQVMFREIYSHEEVSTLLLEAYRHAKDWLTKHEGRVIGHTSWDGIDYKFELNSLARLFELLVSDGHIPVIEQLK